MRITVKRGDTLIEIMFAVAIFGLVAIGAVSLMNSGVAASERALETTMARDEIDAQAEALRFIHDAYASQRELPDSNQDYKTAWERMVKDYVQKPTDVDSFSITSCSVLDKNDSNFVSKNKAFAINTRLLNPSDAHSTPDKVVLSSSTNNLFTVPSLHPRIVYSGADDALDLTEDFGSSGATHTTAARVEGLWVIAVCGDNVTNCNRTSGAGSPTYYDFYIRTCWYAPGSDNASTIGTIIRLYNPNLEVTHYSATAFSLNYDIGNATVPSPIPALSATSEGNHVFPVTTTVPTNRDGKAFMGWCKDSLLRADGSCSSTLINSGGSVTATTSDPNVTLVAIYGYNYTLTYDQNTAGTVNNMPTGRTVSSADSPYNFGTVPSNTPVFVRTASSCKTFMGWSTSPSGPVNVTVGSAITVTSSSPSVTYYAIWQSVSCHDFQIRLTWGSSPSDLDSHLTASGDNSFHIYYSHKVESKANLDVDDTSAYGPEVVTLDTVASTTYTYYVYCWTSCYVNMPSAKVELIDANTGTVLKTYTSPNNLSGNATWNVFRITTDASNIATVTDL